MHPRPLILILAAFLWLDVSSFQPNGLIAQTRQFASSDKSGECSHCSMTSCLLLGDIRKGLPEEELFKKHLLQHKAKGIYVPAMVKISAQFDTDNWHRHEVDINVDLGDIFSVHIPLVQFPSFTKIPGLVYLEAGNKIYPKLDQALTAAKVTAVHQGEDLSQPYTGSDVVVGVIDFGFDYTHPTFCDPTTGSCRIRRVWEQNTLGGSPPSGYSYGHELSTETAIQQAEFDLTASGHGTHVASIVAGSGGDLAASYRGVAYESDLVLVSLNAREGISGNSTGVIDGINYIFQYAESVGKPAVVNVSQGHHTGPHDGTSLSDQAIDAMSGPGRIIVGAVGNEGDESGFYLHFDHEFKDENEILTYLLWPEGISAGETLVEIWGEAGSELQVDLEIFNPSTKSREATGETLLSTAPVTFMSGHMIDQEGDTAFYQGGIEINPLNNRPHAQFYIDNTQQMTNGNVNLMDLLDNDFVQLRFHGTNGTMHAYSANNLGEAFFTDLSGIGADEFVEEIRIKGGNQRSTMGELGGTAHEIISVGGFMTRNSFMNIGGELVSTTDHIGAAYFRSSQGPTLDGRIKPDISAPAGLLAAAQNSFYEHIDEELLTDQISKPTSGEWSFSVRRGTSMSAPMVAGIVALLLEVNPNISPDDVKELLKRNAEQDDFTGSTPNNLWGYGKVNAAGMARDLDQPTSTPASEKSNFVEVFPNPSSGKFTIRTALGESAKVVVRNYSGQVVLEQQHPGGGLMEVNLINHHSGIYFLQLSKGIQQIQRKITVVH